MEKVEKKENIIQPKVKDSNNGEVSQLVSATPLMLKKSNENAMAFGGTKVQRKENSTGLPDNLKTGIESLSGYSMADVNVHYNSSKPTQLNAHAFAQGSDIHLGLGQEKHLAHEAWHVVQQKQGRVLPKKQMKGEVAVNDDSRLEEEADVMGKRALEININDNKPQLLASLESNKTLQRKSLNKLTKRQKLKIKIITKGISMSFKEYFDHKGGRTSKSLATNMKVSFGGNIPTKNDFRTDIKSVAKALLESELVANSTITIKVDVSKTEDYVFRFTYIKRRVGSKKEIIIEGLGKINSTNFNYIKKEQKKRILDSNIQFKFFNPSETSKLKKAISLLPDNILNKIKDVTFKKAEGENPQNSEEGGHYNSDKHLIVLYDPVFKKLNNIFESNFGFVDSAIHYIIHEIGHVLDIRPMELAWTKDNGGSKTRKATSASGYKWKKPKGKSVYEKIYTIQTAFVKAARKDGVRKERKNVKTEVNTKATLKGSITSYGNTDWMELYAENYAMFKVNPKLFQQLRPRIYVYFKKMEAKK